ncbi:spore germination protein [Propionispora sp. 2/2-37]|uniref:spore germination protein n=1 Tax=Propionispora sp. 2/2-37 TaxID=1677858 RepID=UPI001C0FF2BB|nr:spore germination protein [Propionispora sp. 2/2-37]
MGKKTVRYKTLKKLSESLPCASRPRTLRALNTLQKVIKDSSRAADTMESVLLTLRQSILNRYSISGNLRDNELFLKHVLDKSSDLVYRSFQVGNTPGLLIFVDGLTDKRLINTDVLRPLIQYGKDVKPEEMLQNRDLKEILQNRVITSAQLSAGTMLGEAVDRILSGDVAIFLDGMEQVLFASLRSWDRRSVEEPQVDPVIRGPREGFTENLRTNTSMIRRRLKTSDLKMELLQVGRLSQTNVVIVYLAGIPDDALVEEVRRRIGRIEVDAILESGNIEELIEDDPASIFPQFAYTERPDKLASSLLEGQIGILVDNTPFALIAPQTFFQMMQAPDDYYERSTVMTFIRLIRFVFLFIALLLPALYIAVSTFHQGMIPTTLLFSMAASRENIPFPAFVEAMIMEIFFEGLREAGVRLPRPIGQTVSIVGALVIGQAAIQAGIVSAPMVITVSITGIASFIIPRFNQALAIRVLRFLLMILAGTLGLYGVFAGFLAILIHMASLRSFGVPYLSPVAPLEWRALKDVFIRVPWWAMITRPDFAGSEGDRRMDAALRPRPPR